MRDVIFTAICLAVILFTGHCAFADDDAVANPALAELTRFDNGLQLLVLPQPEKTLVQVDVYLSLRGAARNEGLAHLVEHLMFRSSQNIPSGTLRDSLLLLTLTHDATTSSRNIHTISTCIPEFLPRVLNVEAERLGRLQPELIDLEEERLRVLGEHDYRTEVYTGVALNLKIMAMAFEGSFDTYSLVGSKEKVKSFSMENVQGFLDERMLPNQMVVLISGPVDPDTVQQLVKDSFSTLEAKNPGSTIAELPLRPDPQGIIIDSKDPYDLLAVGFRLPYKTPEQAAIVHLTEIIMDRENGHPLLQLFEDEALLILFLPGSWSQDYDRKTSEEKSLKQFWDETRKVKHRVRNSWKFDRHRKAFSEDIQDRLQEPYQQSLWRAQRLADGRELLEAEAMAALVDTLDQTLISDFFENEFTADRAYTALSLGDLKDKIGGTRDRSSESLEINPYLVESGREIPLGIAEITPVLQQAAKLPLAKIEKQKLPNGLPVYLVPHPESDDVYFGAAFKYPYLESEQTSQKPGRLYWFDWLANWGYDAKGSAQKPVGDRPGWNTKMESQPCNLRISAHGPALKHEKVLAAFNKRMNTSRLNHYVLDWIQENKLKTVTRKLENPVVLARVARRKAILGNNHPLVGWHQTNVQGFEDWRIDEANKMHRLIFRSPDCQFVVTGDFQVEKMSKNLKTILGKMKPREIEDFSVCKPAAKGTVGYMFHDPDSKVAVTDYLFPMVGAENSPALTRIQSDVLENILSQRLLISARKTGLDSIKVTVHLVAKNYRIKPTIKVTSLPEDAWQVVQLIRQELDNLAVNPASADEEARARLEMLGPFFSNFEDPGNSLHWLLRSSLYGDIPETPLQDLCLHEPGKLAARLGSFFPVDHFAWSVLADRGYIKGPLLSYEPFSSKQRQD
ncbi:MAG: insulinase family protein [bacterium]|nr:insulinase family protein [bacterium]